MISSNYNSTIIIMCMKLYRPISVADFNPEGYHCPIPDPYDPFHSSLGMYTESGELLRYLLHYCNYFYPVTLNDGNSKTSPSVTVPLQKVAVDRVNYWIKSRFIFVLVSDYYILFTSGIVR